MRHFDDVGNLLHVLGCLSGSNFFSRDTLCSEHGVTKIQLNPVIHAAKIKIGSNRGEVGHISAERVG